MNHLDKLEFLFQNISSIKWCWYQNCKIIKKKGN